MYKLEKRKEIHDSDWITLWIDSIYIGDKYISDYHVVHHKNQSVVILVRKNDSYLFVNALRYITGSVSLELPAGGIEDGETPLEAAMRETLEETGISISNIVLLNSFYPSNGMSDQIVHIIQADFEGGIEKTQDGETCGVKWYSKNEIIELIHSNTITDGCTLVALLFTLI